MQTIKLDVKSYTQGGAAHTSLLIDNHDVGALYLDKKELDLLVSALSVGCLQSDNIVFEQTEPDDGEFEYDVFCD